MSELVHKSELLKYGLSSEQLLQKFNDQLLKDFEMSNAAQYLKPVTDFTYEAVHVNISDALKKISSLGHHVLQQLMYRTDISEMQFNKALKEQEHADSNDVLADLMIKRILQKVILKLIYSK
jgi:hypothetical protein